MLMYQNKARTKFMETQIEPDDTAGKRECGGRKSAGQTSLQRQHIAPGQTLVGWPLKQI
jgi:hypothetical protein